MAGEIEVNVFAGGGEAPCDEGLARGSAGDQVGDAGFDGLAQGVDDCREGEQSREAQHAARSEFRGGCWHGWGGGGRG